MHTPKLTRLFATTTSQARTQPTNPRSHDGASPDWSCQLDHYGECSHAIGEPIAVKRAGHKRVLLGWLQDDVPLCPYSCVLHSSSFLPSASLSQSVGPTERPSTTTKSLFPDAHKQAQLSIGNKKCFNATIGDAKFPIQCGVEKLILCVCFFSEWVALLHTAVTAQPLEEPWTNLKFKFCPFRFFAGLVQFNLDCIESRSACDK